tara:strand:+ start:187 stop:522 length:336 start_codon:yes stop_codon:yes gene_type:complete
LLFVESKVILGALDILPLVKATAVPKLIELFAELTAPTIAVPFPPLAPSASYAITTRPALLSKAASNPFAELLSKTTGVPKVIAVPSSDQLLPFHNLNYRHLCKQSQPYYL